MATATDSIYVKILTETQQSIQNVGSYIKQMAAAYISVKALKELVVSSVKEYIQAEQAQIRLAASLKITGQYSKQAVDDLTAFSQQMQRTTIYTDDATQEAAGLLAQIGNLTTQGIKKAIPALADYASTMGIDLATAARQFAQAIAGGLNTFQRYGIELKDTMSASEKFDTIMKGLNEKFAGMSQEIAKSTGGQLIALKNQWSDLKEEIGGVIAKLLSPALQKINISVAGQAALGMPLKQITSKEYATSLLETLRAYQAQLRETYQGRAWEDPWGKKELAEVSLKIEGLIRLQRNLASVANTVAKSTQNVKAAYESVDFVKLGKELRSVQLGGTEQEEIYRSNIFQMPEYTFAAENPFKWLGAFETTINPIKTDFSEIEKWTNDIWVNMAEINAQTAMEAAATSELEAGWKRAWGIAIEKSREAGESIREYQSALKDWELSFATLAASAESIVSSLVAGDIGGGIQKMINEILNLIKVQAISAAASAAMRGDWMTMGFWLGIAGVTIFGGAAVGNLITQSTSIPSSASKTMSPTIIVQGNVWQTEDLARAVSRAMSRW